MIMMLSTLISSSLMFMLLTHPMSMGFNLLINTLLISIIMGMSNLNFWYSYILFLIMVGGMLVLFIYMTSIASNEKFSFSVISYTPLIVLLTMMTIFIKNFNKLNNYEMVNSQMTNSLNWNLSLIKYFYGQHSILTILLMLYLFIVLLIIVKITKSDFGSLKSY